MDTLASLQEQRPNKAPRSMDYRRKKQGPRKTNKKLKITVNWRNIILLSSQKESTDQYSRYFATIQRPVPGDFGQVRPLLTCGHVEGVSDFVVHSGKPGVL